MDYYKILEVSMDSSSEDIKKQYRKLSLKYHPDKNQGCKICENKFKNISEAYSTLSDPKKRLQYNLKYFQNDSIFYFTEREINMLYNYYSNITSSIEFKLIYKLYLSFIRKKQNSSNIIGTQIIQINNIKYIDISKLYENYIINLERQIYDIYMNKMKLIIIHTNNYPIFLYICNHSSFYTIKNNGYFVNIFIYPQKSKYYIKDLQLHYTQDINIYEYYYGSLFKISLPNELEISCLANNIYKQKQSILKYFGLKGIDGKRDNIIINYNITLNEIDMSHKEFLNTIFNDKNTNEMTNEYYKI
jgi:hypothetical protein